MININEFASEVWNYDPLERFSEKEIKAKETLLKIADQHGGNFEILCKKYLPSIGLWETLGYKIKKHLNPKAYAKGDLEIGLEEEFNIDVQETFQLGIPPLIKANKWVGLFLDGKIDVTTYRKRLGS